MIPFPLPSLDPPMPRNHSVNLVAVALGVGQPLQHKDRCPFAHYEAVGSVGKGTSARARERADLAELNEGRRAHVAIDAAGEATA